ncbi:MAG: hypothetical protein WDM77_08550 [Steroidobacteraceae bacterium]
MTLATPMAAGPAMKRPGSAMTRMPLGKFHQLLSDRCAEALDIRHWRAIVNREATADIQSIQRPQFLAACRGHESGTGLDGLDMLGRICGL